MKIECPNCGLNHKFDFRQDMIRMLVKKFRDKTKVILCMLMNEDGFIITSEADKYVSKELEHKIVSLCTAMRYLAESGFKIIDCEENIGRITYMEEDDINLNGFVMLLKTLVEGVSIITIIPSWLNLNEILPDFEKTISYLTTIFKQEPSQKFSKFLDSVSEIKDAIYQNEYDLY